MSTTAVIAIVIAVVVVLAAVAFFTLARRSDVRGAGALSGETVKRDRAVRRHAARSDHRHGIRRRGRRHGRARRARPSPRSITTRRSCRGRHRIRR